MGGSGDHVMTPEEAKEGPFSITEEKDEEWGDRLTLKLVGTDITLDFDTEWGREAAEKLVDDLNSHFQKLLRRAALAERMAEALKRAIDYIHGDELAHGRDFGTANECREVLAAWDAIKGDGDA